MAGQDLLIQFFDEVWRILRVGGTFTFDVPHHHSPDAYIDVTHRRFFGPLAFEIFWNESRDHLYPRRRWELVSLRISRRAGLPRIMRWYDRKYLTVGWWRWVAFGQPHSIHGVLRKPGVA